MRFLSQILVAVTVAVGLAFLPAAHAGFFDPIETAISNVFGPTKQQIPICPDSQNCSITTGINLLKGQIRDLIVNETASQYAQRVAGNIVAVLSIVGVLFIVYAGFLLMAAGGNEENSKKAKSIIVGVLVGYVIIFLAYSVVSFVTQKILAPAPVAAQSQPQFGP